MIKSGAPSATMSTVATVESETEAGGHSNQQEQGREAYFSSAQRRAALNRQQWRPLDSRTLLCERWQPQVAVELATDRRVAAPFAVFGILTGLDNYTYAYGSTYLPVSTSSILTSSQLALNEVFLLLIVRQKFTPYSVNAVILITVGAAVLVFHSGGDRPTNDTNLQYYLGFFMTLGAAALYGVVLPLLDLTYMKVKQAITYALVMEMRMVISFFATAFCTVGMLVNKDFKAIPREARSYELGELRYYLVLVGCAVFWHVFFFGMVGVVSCSSSVHAGVLNAALFPVGEVLAVSFFDEKLNADKGLALGLLLRGLVSCFYGEFRKEKKDKKIAAPLEQPEKQDAEV